MLVLAHRWSARWLIIVGVLLTVVLPLAGGMLFELLKIDAGRPDVALYLQWGLATGLLGQTLILNLSMLIEPKVIGFSPVLFLTAGPFIYLGYEALAISYIAGIARLCQSGRWQRRLSILAPAGRMTLTTLGSR